MSRRQRQKPVGTITVTACATRQSSEREIYWIIQKCADNLIQISLESDSSVADGRLLWKFIIISNQSKFHFLASLGESEIQICVIHECSALITQIALKVRQTFTPCSISRHHNRNHKKKNSKSYRSLAYDLNINSNLKRRCLFHLKMLQ